MDRLLSKLKEEKNNCNCGIRHREIGIEKIEISHEALQSAATYLVSTGAENVVIVADDQTVKAAGEKLAMLLRGILIHTEIVIMEPGVTGDIVANEASIVKLMLQVPEETDTIIAVGTGTIHDLVSVVSHKMKVPFVSVPTASSVDGFNSKGAPLIIEGVKTSIQSQAPIAIFVPLDILMKAPREMLVAGFGDLIGKVTALADWRFGHLVAGEPFCGLAESVMKEALHSCVENRDLIGKGEEEGVRVLVEALIISGLAMLLMGDSRPGAGGEHHVAHYWEMDFLQKGRSQVRHGVMVGVACGLIADFYKNKVGPLLTDEPLLVERLAEMEQLSGLESLSEAGTGNADIDMQKVGEATLIKSVIEHKQEVMNILESIPSPEAIQGWMKAVGGPSEPDEIGLEKELVERSLQEAHTLVDRYTYLRFYHEVLRQR